jgi:hypothetical protein
LGTLLVPSSSAIPCCRVGRTVYLIVVLLGTLLVPSSSAIPCCRVGRTVYLIVVLLGTLLVPSSSRLFDCRVVGYPPRNCLLHVLGILLLVPSSSYPPPRASCPVPRIN